MIPVIGLFAGKYIEDKAPNWIYNSCYDYRKYTSIDISNPKKFDNINQYRKYIMENESAYISVSENCDSGDKSINSISYPIFNNHFYDTDEIQFNLCQSTEYSSEAFFSSKQL